MKLSIEVKYNKNIIHINEEVFRLLFINNIGNEDPKYQKVIEKRKISFTELKRLSYKYSIPYPLFFSSKEIVNFQLKHCNKKINQSFPKTKEIFYNYRIDKQKVNLNKIGLIIKDIKFKQQKLRLEKIHKNDFVGSLKKNKDSIKKQAEIIRNYFNLDIDLIKRFSKKQETFEYLKDLVEDKNILVSTSSYNFMPQPIPEDLEFSGFCIKDKYFPFIFINDKEGNKKPKIIETEGRKIMTLIYLICLMSKNYFNKEKRVYSLALETILPIDEIKNELMLHFNVSFDTLKVLSEKYKLTPSLILERIKGLSGVNYKDLREVILQNREIVKPMKTKKYSHAKRYIKYNSKKFTKKMSEFLNSSLITRTEAAHILLRKRDYKKDYILDDIFRKLK